jgi:hypothetical protein
MSAVPIAQIPADLGALPSECARVYLVTLERTSGSSLNAVYSLSTFADEPKAPCVGKVLWYLAAEASHVEQSQRDATQWATLHGYDPTDFATGACFADRIEMADRLASLLGPHCYDSLIALYRKSASRNV